MRIRGDVRAFACCRRLAAQLLVVVLCLRALIPIGFMTDAHAAKSGAFRLVICSAYGGVSTIDVDLGLDRGGPQKSSQSHDQPCAFAGLGADVSDLVQTVMVILPRVAHSARRVLARHAVLPPACAGPVLGSRAPPSIS